MICTRHHGAQAPRHLPEAPANPFTLCDLVQFHSPISGGIRRYLSDKAKTLQNFPGIEHHLVIPGAEDRDWTEGKTHYHSIRSPMLPGSKSYRSFHSTSRIHKILDRIQPDLIEVADPYQSAWAAIHWAESHPCKVLLFYHSDYPRAWHRVLRRIRLGGVAQLYQYLVDAYLKRTFGRVDAIACSTEKYERYWSARLDKPVLNTPLGFDPQHFHPVENSSWVKESIGIPPERPLALFVGRLAPEKRLPLLLKAHERLLQRMPYAELLIVGDGEESQHLQELARQLNLRVHWKPFCSDPATLAAYYSACDVLAHPGRNETFGLSVTEALACGTPVVAFLQSGLESACRLVEPNHLVRDSDLDGFAESMRHCMNQARSWKQRWQQHEAIKAQASLDRTIPQMLAHYRELLVSPEPVRNHATTRSGFKEQLSHPTHR
jgi:alpha-1,6-mannosyltransferase